MALTTGYALGRLVRFGLVGGKVLANDKNSKLSIKANYIDVQNKDDYNKVKIYDSTEFSVTVGQDVKWDTNANRTTFEQVLDNVLAGGIMPFTWSIHTTAASPVPNSGDKLLTGSVVTTGVDISFDTGSILMADHTFESTAV